MRKELRTVRGYLLGEVASALQKAIRRADARLAGYWTIELFESGYSMADAAATAADPDDDASRRLELIASYLLPLGLTDERYPVEEHARVAAEILRTRGV